MNTPEYYDGTKLLSLKDINGNQPEIYICTANNSAGKTTWFNRYILKKFLEKDEKFALIYRFDYEMSDIANAFFKDIHGLFFKDYVMKSEKKCNGIYHELFISNDIYADSDKERIWKSCGYALALNKADYIKKRAHLFNDVTRILMDEFQSETDHYCSREITKFMCIHKAIARGNNEQVRYVPAYLVGNPVSLLNPYYVSLGISDRLDNKTKFLRGEGYVLEQGYNKSASEALAGSAFMKAFKEDNYVAYSTMGIYLNDNTTFIDTPKSNGNYICTIRYEGVDYAVREYPKDNIIFCNKRVDYTFPIKIAVTTDDHQTNYVMLRQYDYLVYKMREFFELGVFRFADLQCKHAILATVSYI